MKTLNEEKLANLEGGNDFADFAAGVACGAFMASSALTVVGVVPVAASCVAAFATAME
jgi:hypothetical protein